jgi:hypothetical protein
MVDQFFISYAREDYDFASKVKDRIEQLSKRNFKVWIDEETPTGEDWRFQIDDALVASKAIILVVSQHAVDSSYVTYEWSFARGARKPIVPLVVTAWEDLQNVHQALQGMQSFDFTSKRDANRPWSSLHRRLKEIVESTDDAKWDQLLTRLRSLKQDVRREAIRELRGWPTTEFLYDLNEIILGQKYTWDVRIAAIDAAGNAGENALMLLIRALDLSDRNARQTVGRVLSRFGDIVIQPLNNLLSINNKTDVRRRAAWILGTTGSPDAIKPLVSLLEDHRSTSDYTKRVSDQAADSLMDLAVPEALKHVEDYWLGELDNTRAHWKNTNERVCDYAARVLMDIGSDKTRAAVQKWQTEQDMA